MQECYDERTDGAWQLNAHWSSALGDDLEATQALRSGTLEMVITSTSPLVGLEPALGVFDLPFLFASNEEADAILDGEFGDYIADMMPDLGLVNLAYWENGFRNLTNSVRPVETAEDIEGMRVRVMQNNIFLDTFQTLGANAMPMAFGEVFTALETGAIDAQENPYVTIDTSQFYEVQQLPHRDAARLHAVHGAVLQADLGPDVRGGAGDPRTSAPRGPRRPARGEPPALGRVARPRPGGGACSSTSSRGGDGAIRERCSRSTSATPRDRRGRRRADDGRARGAPEQLARTSRRRGGPARPPFFVARGRERGSRMDACRPAPAR
jgi:tripartite ATP-independent transporter DctP family solute receptor